MNLWALSTGNHIIETNNERLVRAILRELLELGWSSDELSLDLADDAPVLEGAALERWLQNPAPTDPLAT